MNIMQLKNENDLHILAGKDIKLVSRFDCIFDEVSNFPKFDKQ